MRENESSLSQGPYDRKVDLAAQDSIELILNYTTFAAKAYIRVLPLGESYLRLDRQQRDERCRARD